MRERARESKENCAASNVNHCVAMGSQPFGDGSLPQSHSHWPNSHDTPATIDCGRGRNELAPPVVQISRAYTQFHVAPTQKNQVTLHLRRQGVDLREKEISSHGYSC